VDGSTPVPRAHVPGVTLLLSVTALIAGLSSPTRIGERPGVFLALVAAVLALDVLRIDVFDRGRLSPAAVPSIALAMLFGPLGPIAAEAALAGVRAARRFPARAILADFGMLSLTGAATAGVFAALPTASAPAAVASGVFAGLTSYAVNATLLVGLMALGSGLRPLDAWREDWAWLWPHYVGFGVLASGLVVVERTAGGAGLLLLAVPVGLLWLGERQYVTRSRSSVHELRTKHAELEAANATLRDLLEDKQKMVARMHRSYVSTVTSLARTIEAKDPYTGGHTERVAEIACLIAGQIGFREADLRSVRVGAVIHDIGKIGVPDHVLLKPGALDPGELQLINRHPEISTYILGDLDLPPLVKQMVRSHHERYAGGGYPDGLAGEAIPLAARILSVADALDAMTSDRPYRPGRPLDEALAEIDRRAGEQFCPRVVAALHDCLEEGALVQDRVAA
jgi:putative nucleotidyltransferase with HDIG domain